MEDSSQLNQDEEAFLREQLQASHDDEGEQGASPSAPAAQHSHSSSQEHPYHASSQGPSVADEHAQGSAHVEQGDLDRGHDGAAEHEDEDEKPTQQLNLEAPLAWQLQAEAEMMPRSSDQPQQQHSNPPPQPPSTQKQKQKKHPAPKPRSSASGSSTQGQNQTQYMGDGVSSSGGNGFYMPQSKPRSPRHVHGAKPPPVYVVAPPAIVLDPGIKPQDVVGMAGQRNPQPCAYRHARKLASTYEVEHQLAELFQECQDQGEELLAAKLHAVDSLCRKYNQTAMSLLETRAYKQARELLQKAQVLCEDGGVLAAHPRLRQRLEAITLNNLGCLHCRCLNLPAALKSIEAAAAIEQQLAGSQGQESEGEQALAAMHQQEAAEGQDGKGSDGFDDVSEDPCSTLLNMCAVLGMMGQHKEALAKAKEAASMLCRNNGLDQSQVEAWGHAYAPSSLPAHMPHKKFGHDPHTGRPYTAPLPPTLKTPRHKSATAPLASALSSPHTTTNMSSTLSSPTTPMSPPAMFPHSPTPGPKQQGDLDPTSMQQHNPHGEQEQPHNTLQPHQHPFLQQHSLQQTPQHSPQHSPQHNMRARARQPSPLGLPPSTAQSTLSSLSGLQPSRPNTQQRRASPSLPHFSPRIQQGLREDAMPEPHHPHQDMPAHSHSHHTQEFGGRCSPPALPPNSRVGEYKKYYVEKRKQKQQDSSAHTFYNLFAQPPSPSSTFSPVGLPPTPLPPNAPDIAYQLRSLPPGRASLLTMAYFTQGVQLEHLGELHDAFHAYSLAASLPAKVFGRSSHIAVRFNKAFHAFNIKHKRYFSRQQEQELQRAREQEMHEAEELARSHGVSLFNPAQRRKTSLASLLGTRICHPPPESLVRKQILDSYAQDYEPMPPQPEPMPTSVDLMQAHMEKIRIMKQSRLIFL